MKRTEIRKGETYAVMTPSQKVRPWGGSAKKVTVMDAEGFYASPDSYYGRRERPEVRVRNAEGRLVKATDYSHRIEEPKPHAGTGQLDPWAVKRYNQAKGYVQVLVEDHFSGEVYYRVTSVQLSHVRMTWAEFEAETAEAEREQNARYARQRKAEEQRRTKQERAERERDRMNRHLKGSPYAARIVDGQIVLTGSLTAIRELVEDIEHDTLETS